MDKLLQNELFTRLFALVLAILLFLYVQGVGSGGGVVKNLTGVPLEVLGVPAGLSVASISPTTVGVTVRGPSQAVNPLESSSLLATVDLSGAQPGTQKFYIRINDLPSGVQAEVTRPADATVVLQKTEAVSFAVQVQVTGTAASGFVVGTPQVLDKLVVLTGPANAVASVVKVVASVDVQSARTNIVVAVPPVPVDRNGQPVSGVQVLPTEVTVRVPVSAVNAPAVSSSSSAP